MARRKIKSAVFYVKFLPSGFCAIYANGQLDWLTASVKGIDGARTWIDRACAASGITSYSVSFHEEEYKSMLEFERSISA